MKRVVLAVAAAYVLVAAANRVAEHYGMRTCDCADDCWCRRRQGDTGRVRRGRGRSGGTGTGCLANTDEGLDGVDVKKMEKLFLALA